jgi:hypothetical protein
LIGELPETISIGGKELSGSEIGVLFFSKVLYPQWILFREVLSEN